MRPPDLLSAFAALLLSGSGSLDAQHDNVLILLADDLGVDAVGAYGEGSAPPPTPNVDALARSGVLFRNAWANSGCSPTRACMQTGRYSFRTGVGSVVHFVASPPPQTPLGLEEVTLPEHLDSERSGYAHAYIGKWHLGDFTNGGHAGPNLAGWSHFAGTMGTGVPYFSWPRTVDGTTAVSRVYTTTQIVDDALSWIQGAPEPWVCFVAFTAPHNPWHEPPRALHTQSLEGKNTSQHTSLFFKAMVEAMDTEIGRLLSSLGPQVRRRTNVLFLGDNGTAPQATIAPHPRSRAKGTPYKGGVHVPFIVAGPAVQQPGREEIALVGAVDVFATVAQLCGVGSRPPFLASDSVSIVPYLREVSATPRRETIYAERFAPNASSRSGHATIRNARYKLIRFYDAQNPPTDELYEIVGDPLETNDLLSGTLSAQEQGQYAALAAEIARIRDTGGRFARYGQARCGGSNGHPSISASGNPTLGSSYTVHLTNGAASQPALLLMGASDRRWGSLQLPFALSQLVDSDGVARCMVYASGETRFATSTAADGAASVGIALPNVSTLVAARLFHSWLVVDPSAPHNPLGVTTSDGLVTRVGSN